MALAAGSSDRLPTIQNATATWMQEFAPYGILTTDQDLNITSWNEWLAGCSGLKPEQVVGRKLLEVFPDLCERRLSERFTRALAGEASVLSTALHKYLIPLPVTVAESGLPHMLQTARVAPLRENNTVVGTITIIEDVTQREFQAGILHRQQELDRLLASSLARLLQSNDPAEEIGEIYSLVSPALGLDVYASYLLGSDGRTLQLKTSVGFSAKQREAIATLALSPENWAALTSESAATIVAVPSHTDALSRMGLRA
ncbi:MAG: PAS domain-containing protein, partial [Opitutaceae bacterium]